MLNEDYKDMLAALSGAKVKYILIGAYALAVHGIRRATGDIDLFLEPSVETSARVLEALKNFGAPLAGIQPDTFAKANIVYQIGVVPRRIDLLTSIDGVLFQDAWAEKKMMHVEGLEIPVISRRLLMLNKSATGRPKDQLDLKLLEKIKVMP